MSCFLAQKVFESERVLIMRASGGLRAAINKTRRWLCTTDTILNNLRIVPQEMGILFSLEGWLMDWRIGIFQLRVRLCFMSVVHISILLICLSNFDTCSANNIRQFERIINALIRLCVLRSIIIKLVSWGLWSHLAHIPYITSPHCRLFILLNCLIFAPVSTSVLLACVCKLVSISSESVKPTQIKRLHQLLAEGWLSLLCYCILEGYDSIVTHLDLHICFLVWSHEARHAGVLARLAMSW